MGTRLEAPANGITVRMVRIGHGDCFLLALPRYQGEEPFYILIDCGLKPGSQNYLHQKTIGEMVAHIGEATNYHLDLVIITHEHQDHVNGFWKKRNPYFRDFHIEKAWMAWTEDPDDDLANKLRDRHKDQLLELIQARNQLALAFGDGDGLVGRLDGFLNLEFGGEIDGFDLNAMQAAAVNPNKSSNKQALKFVKDKAAVNLGTEYLKPGGAPVDILGTAGYRAFVLGPPRKEDLLASEEPVGTERFPIQRFRSRDFSFAAALENSQNDRATPFSNRYNIPSEKAIATGFFREHYGKGKEGEFNKDKEEVLDNAPWRRIDSEWFYSAETLALKLNQGINNTSLVLAFEMPKSKKVLLFTGDAQRGNWVSWDDQTWDDHGSEVKARDLLARTVLYKVGHHGSHNATLAGEESDNYPNLSWMGRDQYKNEFTAMIPAVNKWALEKNDPPWRHPLPSIKTALETKSQGRVFQTGVDKPKKPKNVAYAEWQAFLKRSTFDDVYFDYEILDE